MRIAVAGAGIQGASIALELARRGHRVDLYDRQGTAFSRASGSNEGKLHLGLVYGNDPSLRTARMVLRGSLSFAPIVERWIPSFAARVPHSNPFDYLVHRDSLITQEKLAAHFAAVAGLYREEIAAPGARYFKAAKEAPDFVCERMPDSACAARFDSHCVRAAWRSIERSIDPRSVATLFREALAAEPKISFFPRHTVAEARALADGRIALSIDHAGARSAGTYDRVANACWEGLLGLDATFAALPDRPWLHRYKLGCWVAFRKDAPRVAAILSVTVVLGAFGDIASFGEREFYVSWYPACLVGSSAAATPPDWGAGLDDPRRAQALEGSLAALGALVPALAAVRPEHIERVETRGGVIFAWGETGIEDRASELHTRHAIGVTSTGNYHSVNTGRYCTAPLFALEACDRMLGAR